MQKIIFILLGVCFTSVLLAGEQDQWFSNANNTNIAIKSMEDSTISINWNCEGFYIKIAVPDQVNLQKEVLQEIDITINNRFAYFNRMVDPHDIKYTTRFSEDAEYIAEQLTAGEIMYITNSDSSVLGDTNQLSFNTKGFSSLFKKLAKACNIKK